MNRSLPALLTVVLLGAPALAHAQAPTPDPGVPIAPLPQPAPVVTYQAAASANETRQRLNELLSQHPPDLREVLQLDPTLMTRGDYLTPYPQLVAFLQQHPEVVRNPTFFIGERYRQPNRTERERTIDSIEGAMTGLTLLTGFIVITTLMFSLLRQALEYRRWRRQMNVQTDLHTKLFDRMTSNDELIAYIQSPVGRRFFESGPAFTQDSTPTSAPVARILWSVQIGVVVAMLGAGFWVAQTQVIDELATLFQVMGTIAFAVGVGFVLSAFMSWTLSTRLGLVKPQRVEP